MARTCDAAIKADDSVWEGEKIRDGKYSIWFRNLDAEQRIPVTKALIDFLKRAYWKRSWIYQELVKSASLKIMCGAKILRFDFFMELILHLQNNSGSHDSTDQNHKYACVGGYGGSRLYDLRTEVAKLDRLHEYRTLLGTYMDFSNVLWAVVERDCFDVRDVIYGIVSLTSGLQILYQSELIIKIRLSRLLVLP